VTVRNTSTEGSRLSFVTPRSVIDSGCGGGGGGGGGAGGGAWDDGE
jgi:hypothetical protein